MQAGVTRGTSRHLRGCWFVSLLSSMTGRVEENSPGTADRCQSPIDQKRRFTSDRRLHHILKPALDHVSRTPSKAGSRGVLLPKCRPPPRSVTRR